MEYIKKNIVYIVGIAVVLVIGILYIVDCTVVTEVSTYDGDGSTAELLFETDDYADEDYLFDSVCEISLSNMVASNDMVSIDSDVISITSEGTYVLNGTSDGVSVNVDTTDKVQIVLDGASMKSADSALINVTASDKTYLRLDGENALATYLTSADGDIDSAIYTMDDMTINGSGSLTIDSYLSGIVAKDDLKITNGDISIEAVCHGINVNDELAISGGSFYVKTNGGQSAAPYQEEEESNFNNSNRPWGSSSSGSSSSSTDDGSWACKAFKCDTSIAISGGSFEVDSYDDAFHSDYSMDITGGSFDVLTGDDAFHANVYLGIDADIDIGYCYEGLEAQRVVVSGGVINVDCYNDGINAAENSVNGDSNGTYIWVSGGDVTITVIEISQSPEADGMDSNGDIKISGGNVMISGTTNTVDTPLDYDGTGEISGGTFLTGGSYSATDQNFNYATQGTIYYSLSSTVTGGKTVELYDSSGELVVSYEPVNAFKIVHISTPDIVSGETYSMVVNSKTYSIKMSSTIYGGSSSSSRL